MGRAFGVTARGEAVDLVTLTDGPCSCEIITYGGAVRALTVPDRRGRPTDVALGFDRLEDYETQDKFMGALIGRCANRVAAGRFRLGDRTYQLSRNDGPNHLHGGGRGFDKRVWRVEALLARQVVLALDSPDGEEGYPGRLRVRVTYRLEGSTLEIRYEARSDGDTLCNLTSHTYFNLGGHHSGPVLDHRLRLFADRFTPVGDSGCLPTGELTPVRDTPLDFRTPVPIGRRIDAPCDQIRFGSGYDHNFVLTGEGGAPRPAARAFCPDTGIALEVSTTLPGLQFYSGNHLDGCPPGKGGAAYGRRHGFCLETQYFPNAPNCPAFPCPLLRKGEVYRQAAAFHFSVEEG